MMLLQAGANTNVILTLNESKTIESPEYVIVFEGDSGKYACKLGTDNSTYPARSNKFTITVQEDPDPLTAELWFGNYGTYKFFVYEMEDADSFDFEAINSTNLAAISGEVERGVMEYITEADAHKYYANNRQILRTYGN